VEVQDPPAGSGPPAASTKRPIDQKERDLPGSSAGCGPVAPKYARKLLDPLRTMLLYTIVGASFEPSKDFCIRFLNLTIVSGVHYGRKAELDANVLAVPLKEPALELGPVVCDDEVRDSEAAHNGLEECHCSSLGDFHHRGNFQPLREFVNGDVEEPVSADGFGKWSLDVHTPYGE